MPITDPAPPSGGIDFKDHLGALLLVTVHGVEHDIQTVHGKSDAARVDIAVVDGPGAGETYEDTLVFPKILTSQLKRNIGEQVLGRLGQGVAKPSQSPPWILNPVDDADRAKGEAYLAQNAKPAVVSAQVPF